MKRVLAILLLVPFIMVLAPPCHAAGNGEVTVSLVDIPAELQERSVLITLSSGPNDTDAVLVELNGLNQYGQAVTLPEGTYYCNAAVQYDALNDWPLREVDGTSRLFSTLYRLPAEPVQRYGIRAGCIRIQSAGRRLHGG